MKNNRYEEYELILKCSIVGYYSTDPESNFYLLYSLILLHLDNQLKITQWNGLDIILSFIDEADAEKLKIKRIFINSNELTLLWNYQLDSKHKWLEPLISFRGKLEYSISKKNFLNPFFWNYANKMELNEKIEINWDTLIMKKRAWWKLSSSKLALFSAKKLIIDSIHIKELIGNENFLSKSLQSSIKHVEAVEMPINDLEFIKSSFNYIKSKIMHIKSYWLQVRNVQSVNLSILRDLQAEYNISSFIINRNKRNSWRWKFSLYNGYILWKYKDSTILFKVRELKIGIRI